MTIINFPSRTYIPRIEAASQELVNAREHYKEVFFATTGFDPRFIDAQDRVRSARDLLSIVRDRCA